MDRHRNLDAGTDPHSPVAGLAGLDVAAEESWRMTGLRPTPATNSSPQTGRSGSGRDTSRPMVAVVGPERTVAGNE